MRVTSVDERRVVHERRLATFVVYIYLGDDSSQVSWSVSSYRLEQADLPQTLQWLRDTLPANSCWSLGIVMDVGPAAHDGDLAVSWLVGSDVLNIPKEHRSDEEQLAAADMLSRRNHVNL